jgi:hypothetical protein
MKLIEILKHLEELQEKGFGKDSDEFSKAWDEFYARKNEATLDEIRKAMKYVEGRFSEVIHNSDFYTEVLEEELEKKKRTEDHSTDLSFFSAPAMRSLFSMIN